MQKSKVMDVLYNLAVILFAVVFIYLFGLNIFYNFQHFNFFSILFFIILIVAYILLFSKIKKWDFKYQRVVKWSLLLFLFLLLVFLGYKTRVGLYDTWDFGGLIRDSYKNAHGDRSNAWYFARYPNNIPLLVIETILCKGVLLFYKGLTLGGFRGITILVNAIVIFASILLMNKIIKKNIGESAARLSTFLSILFCPLYLYCSTLYTDTISMLLLLVSFFLYYEYDNASSKNKKFFFFFLLITFIYLGFKFKATNLFLIIAIIIEFIYENKWKEIFLSILLLIGISFPINFSIGLVFQTTTEEKDKYEFPYTHWIMMALNPNTNGEYDWQDDTNLVGETPAPLINPIGGYNWDDVNYTISFKNYEEKKKANMKLIRQRLKDYGVKGLTYRIFVEKNSRTWADPTLETSSYLSWHPIENNFFTELFTLQGSYHKIYRIYITTIYLFLLFGAAVSSIYNLKEKNKFVFISQLMLVGIFIFELFWEGNPRYIYNFLPFLMITACYGYIKILENFNSRKEWKNRKIQEV